MASEQGGLALPRGLDDIDAAFMTKVLRQSGAIGPDNHVVDQAEEGVGMTAGYFSSIKRIICTYAAPTDAPRAFVVKAWPQLEIAPKESIRAMFVKDIMGYRLPAARFYPRPITHLAAFDADNDLWALVMEDAAPYATQKLHEAEMSFDDVMRMIPGLVEVALAWEGADQGDKAAELDAIGVLHWASPENLANFTALMPGSAKIFDHATNLGGSTLINGATWHSALGGHGFIELYARKCEAFYAVVHPARGATCTLSHGDMRGDNIFFCDNHPAYPHGWLCIDFQQMFRGPVPSDLAYLMSTGSVLPDVYSGDNLMRILRAFYDRFMAGTRVYPDYSFDQFTREFATMTTVNFAYFAAFGVPYFQGSAYANQLPMRVELGGQGATLDDLAPEEHRQRMWWRKTWANQRELFRRFDLRAQLEPLPDNSGPMGEWAELPPHLR